MIFVIIHWTLDEALGHVVDGRRGRVEDDLRDLHRVGVLRIPRALVEVLFCSA